jgi:predicted ArsR family transcriptional regulator
MIMSKLGDTADKILELLNERKNITVDELVKKVSLNNNEILNFLNQGGLIELAKEEIRITDFGSELITAE